MRCETRSHVCVWCCRMTVVCLVRDYDCMEARVGRADGVGVGELLGVLSLAIDLGSGQPQGHGLRTCMLAVGLVLICVAAVAALTGAVRAPAAPS